MVFSKKYLTFSDWMSANANLSRYNLRIIKYVIRHPRATLKEARGHKEEESEYRTSLTINNIPINSTKEDPDYSNALIQAYDWDENYLADLREPLEEKLIECIDKFFTHRLQHTTWHIQEWNKFSYIVGYEAPTEISEFDPKIDGTWAFKIERKGRVVYTLSGYTKNL